MLIISSEIDFWNSNFESIENLPKFIFLANRNFKISRFPLCWTGRIEYSLESAKSLIKSNRDLLNKIEKEYNVPANYLVALWGIETHFGRHKGKVDIISALSTLSYDKRRSEFFSKELLILLKLIDGKII